MSRDLLLHYRFSAMRGASAALIGAGLLVAAPDVLHAEDIDLADLGTTHPGFRIDGIDPSDQSGHSVSGAGDVNGDGLADLIIGALGANPGGNSGAGESYVVFGKTTNTAIDLSALGTGGFRIDGIDESDRSGFSVSGAGDVNGDGLADLIVGAPFAHPGGDSNAGESYVVFGKATNTAVDLSALGTGGFRIDGIDLNDLSGSSVSGAGDVNGDGLSDLIVGAYFADPGGENSAGESYVVFGKATTTTVDLSTLGSGGFRIDGIDANDRSGYSVSGVGDVNGDGLADLVVGAPFTNPGGDSQAGESYVVFGKATTTAVDLSTLGSGGFRIDGIDANDRSGSKVSGAGDVNGDGLADLVVGALFANPGGDIDAGESYVVFGKATTTAVDLSALGSGGFRIDGIDSNDRSGISVSGAGDVNGDGLADLIIGAEGADPGGESEAGESYVIFGKTTNTAVDLSALGSGGFRIDGIDLDDESGSSVSGAGDVNGDGLADLIVGASRADPGGDGLAGESYVIFSPSTAPASATYMATAPAGNAPRVAIGVTGDGSNDGTPDSRCWIDFADGSAASTQTVTINRGQAVAASPTVWEVSTDRTGWTSAEVTFKYTDAEVTGLTEADLRLYKADSIGGPYTLLTTTVDTSLNTVSATVSSFSFFAVGTTLGLPVEVDTFTVE